ncbi:MAG: flavodoxin domain-containing protein [Thermoplasmatota archaeon]
MKYVMVYWSRTGINKKIVESLSEILKKKGAETQILKTDEADPCSMPDADVYVFSAPTEAFRIQKDMRFFLKKITGLQGKKYAVINTHGMKRNWVSSMKKVLENKQMDFLASVDFKVEKNNDKKLELPSDWEQTLSDFSAKL